MITFYGKLLLGVEGKDEGLLGKNSFSVFFGRERTFANKPRSKEAYQC
jgi:hypothetical protein